MPTNKDKALPTDPDKVQAAVDAQLKEQKKDDTIEVAASEAPVSPVADAAEDVAALQEELEAARAALAAAEAELAAARSVTAGTVEVELEEGAPKWVQQVSGMARKDIAGFVVLPGNVLVVKDKDGREGHRFTFLPHQQA